jgi:hypothetical protein
MLRLHEALKNAKIRHALLLRFRPMFHALLHPVKQHIARHGMQPSKFYVGVINKSKKSDNGMYDIETKRRLFPTFVQEVILKDEMKRNHEIKMLIDELIAEKVNDYDMYDDAVKEEIGRILLEYEPIMKLKGGGGKTRKRSRIVRRHPKTRICKPHHSKFKSRRHRPCVYKNKQTRKKMG